MRTSLKGRMAIARDEAAVTVPYDDGIGVPTQGIGHTFRAGPPVVSWISQPWSLARIAAIFTADLTQYEQAVLRVITRPMCQHEFDALVSFCYNVGPANFARSSVAKRFNRSGAKAAGPRLLLWNKAGGRVMKGLTHRREAERALLERGDYGKLSRMLLYRRTNARRRPIDGVLIDPAKLFEGVANARKDGPTPVEIVAIDDAMADGMLERGEGGGSVARYQDDLIAAGHGALMPTGADGVFGHETETATKAFQAAAGIRVDGKAGPQTFAALSNALDEAEPAAPPAPTEERASAATKTATGGVIAGGGAAMVAAEGWGFGGWIALAGGAVVLATLAYLAWRYRADIAASLAALARRL